MAGASTPQAPSDDLDSEPTRGTPCDRVLEIPPSDPGDRPHVEALRQMLLKLLDEP